MVIDKTGKNFLLITACAAVFFGITAVVQVLMWDTEILERFVHDGEPTVRVSVGEMYFKQENSDLPRNVLEAEVGDIIAFHNEGRVSHTVTIPEYDLDEIIDPGDTVTLYVDTPVEDILVNCRFHIGHEARLTVREAGESRDHGSSPVNEGAEGGDRSIRSASDRVERLEYETVDGVKEFRLTAENVLWEYADDVVIESWGYNGSLPGPEIRVREGDEVRIIVENTLPEATTVHWHGLDVPFEQDGVPHLTQYPIESGDEFVYEFVATPAGTRFYHTHGSHHGDEGTQMDMGLSGPFIIEPEGFVEPDVDQALVLTERTRDGIYPIHGQIYPNTKQIRVSEGDRVRLRLINAGSSHFHPMHLHGHQFEVVAWDGNPVPASARQLRNTITLHPGETVDIEFVADNPGRWLFHCHELQHSAGGMIAEVVYDGF